MLGFSPISQIPVADVVTTGAITTSFSADYGAFALTGEAALFEVTEPAAQGSFTLTGQSVAFQAQMLAAQGGFTLTGEPILFSTTFVAAQGSFALTGQSAGLQRQLPVDTGTFLLTGQSVSQLLTTFAIPAGSFTLSGEDVAFQIQMLAADGAFVFTGYDAVLFKMFNVTDTDAIQLPINCVLMGRQLYRYRERASELWPRNLREAGAIPKSGVAQLKGDKPSFTVTTGKKGYN